MRLLFTLLVFATSHQMAYSAPCEQFNDFAGKILPVNELEKKGLLLPGVWVTNDYNEYREFPQEIRRAVAAYTRRKKSSVQFFIEDASGSIRQLGSALQVGVGYLVGTYRYSEAAPYDPPIFSGAAYVMSNGRPFLLFEIDDGIVTSCKTPLRR